MPDKCTSTEWYCPKCQSYVSGESVTYDEIHELCGTFIGVVWQEEIASLTEKVDKQQFAIKQVLMAHEEGYDVPKIWDDLRNALLEECE